MQPIREVPNIPKADIIVLWSYNLKLLKVKLPVRRRNSLKGLKSRDQIYSMCALHEWVGTRLLRIFDTLKSHLIYRS